MMTVQLLAVALGLAMDSFAVSLGAGTHAKVRGFRATFRLWFHFGLFQALMTIAGWFMGASLEKTIAGWDRWVAFGLLALVGLKMMKEGLRPGDGAGSEDREDPSRGLRMLSLSVATSLDALAVGISLGVLAVKIWYPGLVIGLVTALLSLVGLRLGQSLGERFGRGTEVAGGLILILIALKILVVG
jgi:manganese efflux pump family protein